MTSGVKRMSPRLNPSTTSSEATAAAGVARAWLDLAVAKGVSRTALLERAQLGPHALSNQDDRFPVAVLHTGEVSIDLVSAKMGFSRPTLFRRLKAEGVTFEQVLDQLRHTLAVSYLQGQKVSVNETAYLVGFSDPSAFSRAFKRWTGSPPSRVRLAAQL
jgi:AraC-like DNA-binding protein